MIPVSYRKATADDLPFIFSTWLRHARHQGDRRFMTNRVYFDNEKKRVARILEKSMVVVVHNPEDVNQLYAWASVSLVKDLFIIHYCYVKSAYQRSGIMTRLMETIYPRFRKDQTAITHMSKEADQCRDKYRLFYNPYIEELIG